MSLRLRTNSQITTGAPTNEVIALIGNVNSLLGNYAIASQISIKMAPKQSTAGINMR